jgi:hypothetical protein
MPAPPTPSNPATGRSPGGVGAPGKAIGPPESISDDPIGP